MATVLALDRKQCMFLTGLLNGHCTLRQHQYIMGFLGNAMCKKHGLEQKSFYHVLCQYPVLTKHGLEIFSSAFLNR
jgi:hypothetical protein